MDEKEKYSVDKHKEVIGLLKHICIMSVAIGVYIKPQDFMDRIIVVLFLLAAMCSVGALYLKVAYFPEQPRNEKHKKLLKGCLLLATICSFLGCLLLLSMVLIK